VLTGVVAAVVAAVVTITLGVVLDRRGARSADDAEAALPVTAASPSVSTGAVSPSAGASRARRGTPANTANPTPRTSTTRVPAPTSRPAGSPPAQPGAPVSAYGGVARVLCDDKTARIVRLDVATGYVVDDYRPGPADEVRAVLTSPANRSEIKVRCTAGAVAAEIKESPIKPPPVKPAPLSAARSR
jgi:hypothetical protein